MLEGCQNKVVTNNVVILRNNLVHSSDNVNKIVNKHYTIMRIVKTCMLFLYTCTDGVIKWQYELKQIFSQVLPCLFKLFIAYNK